MTSKNKKIKKFEQVFLYVLSKVGGKPNVGETVLHKLMYFIDFDFFEKYNDYLTGIQYKKNHHGPTFDKGIIDNMIKNKSIVLIPNRKNLFTQKKYLPKIKPDLSILSANEIKHIDNTLMRHSDKTAKEIEEYSHKDIPWMITPTNSIISYESVFYRDDNYSVADYELNAEI